MWLSSRHFYTFSCFCIKHVYVILSFFKGSSFVAKTFGVPLDELVAKDCHESGVPSVVHKMCQFILDNGWWIWFFMLELIIMYDACYIYVMIHLICI